MNKNQNFGVTLVELLVVITIMTIVTALIIPRVRVLNKDRNIREASRVIGSLLASASNYATAQGASGVAFVRNPNFVEDNDAVNDQIYFACTQMFLLRAIPDFSGDSDNARARVFVDDVTDVRERIRCQIEVPFNHDITIGSFVVRQFDRIRFGNSPTLYTIDSPVEQIVNPDPPVSPGNPDQLLLSFTLEFNDGDNDPLTLELSLPDQFSGAPAPRLSGVDIRDPQNPDDDVVLFDQEFVIERQPQIVESSRVDLPTGYYIDMRYSGPLDPIGDTDGDGIIGGEDNDVSTFTALGLRNTFGTDPNLPPPTGPSSDVVVLFDSSGGISNLQYSNRTTPIGQSLALFVTEYDVENADLAGNVAAIRTCRNILSVPETLWVTVNNTSGGVNVSNNNIPAPAPAPPNPDLGQNVISSSRFLSRFRNNAAQ